MAKKMRCPVRGRVPGHLLGPEREVKEIAIVARVDEFLEFEEHRVVAERVADLEDLADLLGNLDHFEALLLGVGHRFLDQDVDAVLVACSNLQRAYPAVAIEVQNALGARGWAYDLNVACSSATFGLQAAVDAVRTGSARCAVVVSPEITSGHNNFELRDYHFIFGDACTAMVVEPEDEAVADERWSVLGTRLQTIFSNNIRNDFGFLNRSEDGERPPHELVFRQRGRQVYREVCPKVAEHIEGHLKDQGLEASDLRRMWLHQANLGMNVLIAKRVLGREATPDEAPVILDEYANTSSAGSVIAFHLHRADLASGDLGILCSFGAGYSIGSAILRRS